MNLGGGGFVTLVFELQERLVAGWLLFVEATVARLKEEWKPCSEVRKEFVYYQRRRRRRRRRRMSQHFSSGTKFKKATIGLDRAENTDSKVRNSDPVYPYKSSQANSNLD